MKLTTLTALALFAVSASAFAQSTSGANATQATQPDSSNSMSLAQNTQWTPAYGQPAPEKTRAQVYHSLVRAEQDGQLSYLDKTLYAHH
jgi:hypothetical protein